ncbi:hypothetical protein ACFORG_19850 [Lutimaribacter marinistellae]|uniref:Uncharacterized protein n=1 Tax=Lutimaribacter marinistellae TaxID=1820329 RepID=A0ABV7TK48_9RHOB
MSAPETNVERQSRRHKPSLFGIGAAVLAAAVIGVVIWMLGDLSSEEQSTAAPVGQAAEQD